jgi:hypothetical protein
MMRPGKPWAFAPIPHTLKQPALMITLVIPALMHFCELHALLILPISELGSTVPRKMGLNYK